MACDPNTLLDSAKCIESCLTIGQMQAIKVYLLAQIAGRSTATGDDISALLDSAKCIESCVTLGQMKAVEVWLLCQMAGV